MIDVTDVSGDAFVTVTIAVTGAPPLKATWQERSFLPAQVHVRYLYKPQVDGDGWTVHVWVPRNVSATGPRILKPAPDGSQRLGVEHLTYKPISQHDHPEWLRQLVHELRPSGDVTLAGVS
jgi:hypothetical protein